MAQSREYIPQFANLPEYAGPGLPTGARNIVAGLRDLPGEKYIQYVDPQVALRKHLICASWPIAVSEDFPPGTQVKAISPHVSAYWTRTAAIQTVQGGWQP
jgi:hypothetical protein